LPEANVGTDSKVGESVERVAVPVLLTPNRVGEDDVHRTSGRVIGRIDIHLAWAYVLDKRGNAVDSDAHSTERCGTFLIWRLLVSAKNIVLNRLPSHWGY
jgi:hypothetical protein